MCSGEGERAAFLHWPVVPADPGGREPAGVEVSPKISFYGMVSCGAGSAQRWTRGDRLLTISEWGSTAEDRTAHFRYFVNNQQRRKTMSMKEAYQQKIEAQLDEWKAEIEKMKAQARNADAEAQLEYYKQIEELRMKQETAREKLGELKQAGEDAWEDMKSGIELAWGSLGEAMKSARSRFM